MTRTNEGSLLMIPELDLLLVAVLRAVLDFRCYRSWEISTFSESDLTSLSLSSSCYFSPPLNQIKSKN
jgi:hypothetical protein